MVFNQYACIRNNRLEHAPSAPLSSQTVPNILQSKPTVSHWSGDKKLSIFFEIVQKAIIFGVVRILTEHVVVGQVSTHVVFNHRREPSSSFSTVVATVQRGLLSPIILFPDVGNLLS